MATLSEAFQLALEHHRAGRLDRAELLYRRILEHEPDHADALHLLGAIAHQAGRHAAAVECISRAITLYPTEAAYHNNLGEAYRAMGKLDDATACYRRALELADDMAAVHCNLGEVYRAQGKSDEAIACYRRALTLEPELGEASNNLGLALERQGALVEAVDCFRQAVAHSPGLPAIHDNLGSALQRLGKVEEARACFRSALNLQPDFLPALNNLGTSYKDAGQFSDAVSCYQRALEIQPTVPEIHNNLGLALHGQGQLDGAVACYERALQLWPDYVQARSNLLLCEQARPGVTLAGLAAAHAEWDRRHGLPLRPAQPPVRDRNPERRLRLGFVSADFGRHPVGWFLVGVLEQLQHHDCDVVCYCDRGETDDLTARCAAAVGTWRRVEHLSDAALAEQIQADAIDLLVDLSGRVGKNRLLTFARKPAPIQLAWIGYPGTTGLSAMDYLVADRYEVPPEAEPHYREKILRLPDGYVCYTPPADAPAVGPLPAVANGYVTFGCFNHVAKISRLVFPVWAEILRRVPGSRLMLKTRGLDRPEIRERFVERFAMQAVELDRIDLLGESPQQELFDSYNCVDLALDPFPYSGGLTTCEALWMGVPVITCPGETFAARHSLSHLSNVGLQETVTGSLAEYVERAVTLAIDTRRLAELRAGLRDRMTQSPLCDAQRFTRNLVDALRQAWRTWCGSSAPRPLAAEGGEEPAG